MLNQAVNPCILFSIMGNNKPIDKAIVQKVFEMRAAGDSASKIGSFSIILAGGQDMS